MNCRDTQESLAFYGEAEMSDAAIAAIESHLSACPICRERHSANRKLRLELSTLPRSAPPAPFSRSLSYKLREEISLGRPDKTWFTSEKGEWFQHRVMPYAVGAMASLLVGFITLSSMVGGLRDNVAETLQDVLVRTALQGVMIAANRDPYADAQYSSSISAVDYAILRRDVSTDSPSLNPEGALLSMSRSLVERSDARAEDGVVVVADVLSNGLATIREIVDPDSNRRVIGDLEKAFEAELGNAPFVPAQLDNRSDSVRIVLRFQSVDVPAETVRSSRR